MCSILQDTQGVENFVSTYLLTATSSPLTSLASDKTCDKQNSTKHERIALFHLKR